MKNETSVTKGLVDGSVPRRVLAAFFVGLFTVFATSMLFAGGQKESSAPKAAASGQSYSGQEISVVFPGNAPPQALLDMFTKKTGIKVKWTNTGWDALQTKITAAASANTYFADVTDVDWSRVGEFYRTKWFVPLNKYFDIATMKQDVPQLGSFMDHNVLIGLPVDASIMLTTINTADFKKAGITTMPTTIAEYTADLKKLQSSGVNQHPLGIPFAAAEGLSTYWYQMTSAFGGNVLSKDFKPLFTSSDSPGYKAMEWMVNAYQSGLVPKGNINTTDSEEMQSEMANNQISTIFSDYSGNIGTIYNVKGASKVIGQVEYIPTPGANGVAPNRGNPDGMGIPTGAKHVGAGVEFLKWFTSSEIQGDIAGANGPSLAFIQWPLPMRLSAMKALFVDDQQNQSKAMYQLFKNHSEAVFPEGAPPWYGQFSNAVYTNIHTAALGQETVAQAIKNIADTVNKLNNQG